MLKTGAAITAMAAAPRVFGEQSGRGGSAMSIYEKGPVRIHYEVAGSGFPLLLIAGSVEQFAEILAVVEADGGGDYPEDLNEGLSQAIHDVEWRVDGTVSLVFLVADAPPHLDYGQENHYAFEMLGAVQRGVKIYPIASSGLDEQGEYVFRQLAQFTGGRFIFLTYGAEGPGSSGTETDLNVSDYTVSSLDQLVVRIVEEELAYLVR
jgi:hypothetical protein